MALQAVQCALKAITDTFHSAHQDKVDDLKRQIQQLQTSASRDANKQKALEKTVSELRDQAKTMARSRDQAIQCVKVVAQQEHDEELVRRHWAHRQEIATYSRQL